VVDPRKGVAGNNVTGEGKGMMSPEMTSQEMVLRHKKWCYEK